MKEGKKEKLASFTRALSPPSLSALISTNVFTDVCACDAFDEKKTPSPENE
jgi:hypothetical protein